MTKILQIVLITALVLIGYTYYQGKIRVQVDPEFNNYPSVGKYQGSDASKRTYSSLIRLYMTIDEAHFFCSGAVIDDYHVLTAAHCVVDDYRFMIKSEIYIKDKDFKGPSIVGKAVALDLERDVALIQGDFSQFNRYTADFSGLFMTRVEESPLMSCGFPGGQLETYCVYLRYNGNFLWRMSMLGGPIFRGCSGGPVINRDGVIVGVNSAVTQSNVIIGTLTGFLEEL